VGSVTISWRAHKEPTPLCSPLCAQKGRGKV